MVSRHASANRSTTKAPNASPLDCASQAQGDLMWASMPCDGLSRSPTRQENPGRHSPSASRLCNSTSHLVRALSCPASRSFLAALYTLYICPSLVALDDHFDSNLRSLFVHISTAVAPTSSLKHEFASHSFIRLFSDLLELTAGLPRFHYSLSATRPDYLSSQSQSRRPTHKRDLGDLQKTAGQVLER